jgi:hypothetical protein
MGKELAWLAVVNSVSDLCARPAVESRQHLDSELFLMIQFPTDANCLREAAGAQLSGALVLPTRSVDISMLSMSSSPGTVLNLDWPFNKTVVLQHRFHLEERGHAPRTLLLSKELCQVAFPLSGATMPSLGFSLILAKSVMISSGCPKISVKRAASGMLQSQ